MLDEPGAKRLVESYISQGLTATSTQGILDGGAVPRLRDYHVRPGKVSDCIFGGTGSYVDKTTGETVEFENPPLQASDGTPLMLMVRTSRISTHDIGRGEVPFKDQVLAANHHMMRELVQQDLGTSQYDTGLSDTSVVIAAEHLQTIPVEMVLRAYMAKSSTSTSLYQAFARGERTFCGHQLSNDLVTNGRLPYVMDTPSTKAERDESVTPDELFDGGVCTPQQYAHMRNAALVAFGRVSQYLAERNLILVDTKTEHGLNRKGKIVSQDELYTMDSSRFWLADEYNKQVAELREGTREALEPRSFSKEFARGFSKGEGGYTEEEIIQIAVRYLLGAQHLLGRIFVPDMRPRDEQVETGLQQIVERLVA